MFREFFNMLRGYYKCAECGEYFPAEKLRAVHPEADNVGFCKKCMKNK